MRSTCDCLCADRIKDVQFSPVRKVLERAREIEGMGRKVVHFQVGEPDFDTPREIIDATIEALNSNKTHYAPNRGTLSLRKAICKKLADEDGVVYGAEDEIIVTIGGAEGINNAILAFVNEGDEVIIFTPAFMNYENCIKIAGGKAVSIPLKSKDNFDIDPDEVRKSITDKTKMIIINNPSNPTGVVFSREALSEIAKIACEHDILVLSDEMYDQILYENAEFYSMASFDGMKERTITLKGFSKTYAMTGWRLGYIAADKKLIPYILKVHQYTTTCAPTFIQEGVAKSMLSEKCQDEVTNMLNIFDKRRELILEGLRNIGKLSLIEPMGAFYVFVNVKDTGLNGAEFAYRLLEEKGVAVVPGAGFSEDCSDFVRISYAASEEDIKLGLQRIREFIYEL